MNITLITGGARSGKSHFAQELAAKTGGKVLFVATAEAGDEEMRQRIEKHRASRPESWQTLEAPVNVASALGCHRQDYDTAIIDCITMLVNNIFQRHAGLNDDAGLMEEAVLGEIEGLVEYARNSPARFLIVTNEVGLGIVPADPVSRLYRDLLGKA
ncbi:MAG: bifunctional adenosylcobinamide kinase/adenosylcobinamide-phosphate guanylyltransferase, partial [Dehalococcoidales bacterium]|nr:bifunctional adenosylcobinamide kinase/adenosylcobinamide-phosphate guanylyltransferase [Dehalococcoidales bacterium]